jgi:hypothetical protein
MEIESFKKRGQALENEYFQRVDQELLAKLRQSTEHKARVEELIKATGIHDETVADHLVDAGIDAGNVAALTLTPLVFVAWADGSVAASERQSVISAALRRGVNSHPTAFALVEQWLQTRPTRDLWAIWKEYANDLHQSLPAATANKLTERLLSQAKEVAEASGGVLGVGKISAAEQRILDEIQETLPKRSVT